MRAFSFLTSLLAIILIDLSLSGDNAAVIGLAIRELPPKLARRAAFIGASGAILARVVFTAAATLMMRVPYLNAIGGAILIWITWKLVVADDEGQGGSVSGRFWSAVWAIILADMSCGFDNVMGVAGTAHGSVPLVVIGLLISMPILIWGSTWVSRLMNSYPMVIFVGAAVLAHTSLVMIVDDQALGLARSLGLVGRLAPWLAALGVLVYGWLRTRRRVEVETASEGQREAAAGSASSDEDDRA